MPYSPSITSGYTKDTYGLPTQRNQNRPRDTIAFHEPDNYGIRAGSRQPESSAYRSDGISSLVKESNYGPGAVEDNKALIEKRVSQPPRSSEMETRYRNINDEEKYEKESDMVSLSYLSGLTVHDLTGSKPFAINGKTAVYTINQTVIFLENIDNPCEQTILANGHNATCTCVAISPCGRYILSAQGPSNITNTVKQQSNLNNATTPSSYICIWDRKHDFAMRKIPISISSGVRAASFSPNSQFIAISSYPDALVSVYDLYSGDLIGTYISKYVRTDQHATSFLTNWLYAESINSNNKNFKTPSMVFATPDGTNTLAIHFIEFDRATLSYRLRTEVVSAPSNGIIRRFTCGILVQETEEKIHALLGTPTGEVVVFALNIFSERFNGIFRNIIKIFNGAVTAISSIEQQVSQSNNYNNLVASFVASNADGIITTFSGIDSEITIDSSLTVPNRSIAGGVNFMEIDYADNSENNNENRLQNKKVIYLYAILGKGALSRISLISTSEPVQKKQSYTPSGSANNTSRVNKNRAETDNYGVLPGQYGYEDQQPPNKRIGYVPSFAQVNKSYSYQRFSLTNERNQEVEEISHQNMIADNVSYIITPESMKLVLSFPASPLTKAKIIQYENTQLMLSASKKGTLQIWSMPDFRILGTTQVITDSNQNRIIDGTIPYDANRSSNTSTAGGAAVNTWQENIGYASKAIGAINSDIRFSNSASSGSCFTSGANNNISGNSKTRGITRLINEQEDLTMLMCTSLEVFDMTEYRDKRLAESPTERCYLIISGWSSGQIMGHALFVDKDFDIAFVSTFTIGKAHKTAVTALCIRPVSSPSISSSANVQDARQGYYISSGAKDGSVCIWHLIGKRKDDFSLVCTIDEHSSRVESLLFDSVEPSLLYISITAGYIACHDIKTAITAHMAGNVTANRIGSLKQLTPRIKTRKLTIGAIPGEASSVYAQTMKQINFGRHELAVSSLDGLLRFYDFDIEEPVQILNQKRTCLFNKMDLCDDIIINTMITLQQLTKQIQKERNAEQTLYNPRTDGDEYSDRNYRIEKKRTENGECLTWMTISRATTTDWESCGQISLNGIVPCDISLGSLNIENEQNETEKIYTAVIIGEGGEIALYEIEK